MTKKKIFYKYRTVNSELLDSLCFDRVYYANPSTFNDPMDCMFAIECDSSIEDLRKLYFKLKHPRISKESEQAIESYFFRAEARGILDKIARDTIIHDLNMFYSNANDPFYECPRDKAEIGIVESAIREELKKYYNRGVFCLSTTYSSQLLWSHYGDQHKGICIGYSTNRDPEPELGRVLYGNMVKIPTSLLMDAFVNENEASKIIVDEEILLRKSTAWKYENEWRLIGNVGLHDSPLLLEEITFGMRCPAAVKHTIERAIADRTSSVKLYQMAHPYDSYKMKRHSYYPNNEGLFLPKVAQSGKEIFGIFDDVEQQLPDGLEPYVIDSDND